MSHCKSPIKNRILILLIISCSFGVTLTGCAKVKEGIRSAAGISTKELENHRQESVKKAFSCDYFTCYSKTREVLGRIGSYIYAEDKNKGLIAVYVSDKDTTPVGLFFKEIDSSHTQIEISSPSSFTRDSIAEKIFANLEASLYQDEKK